MPRSGGAGGGRHARPARLTLCRRAAESEWLRVGARGRREEERKHFRQMGRSMTTSGKHSKRLAFQASLEERSGAAWLLQNGWVLSSSLPPTRVPGSCFKRGHPPGRPCTCRRRGEEEPAEPRGTSAIRPLAEETKGGFSETRLLPRHPFRWQQNATRKSRSPSVSNVTP